MKKLKEKLLLPLIWLLVMAVIGFNLGDGLRLVVVSLIGIFLWEVLRLFSSKGLDSVKYQKLARAVMVANEKTGFIKKIEEWEDQENFYPFDKGVDPYDVLSTLHIANMLGSSSLKEEKDQYGFIKEL